MSQQEKISKTVQNTINDPIDFFLKLSIFSEYTECVTLLLKSVSEETNNINKLASPIIYNFKHALELGLKLFEYIHKGDTKTGHNILSIDNRIKKHFADKYNLSGDDSVVFYLNEKQSKFALKYIDAVKKIDVPEELRKTLLDILKEMNEIDYGLITVLVDKYHRVDDQNNTRYRYANPDVSFEEKKKLLEDIKIDIKCLSRLDYFCNQILWEGIITSIEGSKK